MSNIDMTRILTADAKQAARGQQQQQQRKAECRARILAVWDQPAQLNLAAAASLGALSATQLRSYKAGVRWVRAMRAAAATGARWPTPPKGLADLAAAF